MAKKIVRCFAILVLLLSITSCSQESQLSNENKVVEEIILEEVVSDVEVETVYDGVIREKDDFFKYYDEGKKDFEKLEIDFNGYSSQGGVATAYYDVNTLKAIELVILGDMGKVYYDYYLIGEEVIYLHVREVLYEKNINEGEVKVVNKNENEFLLDDEMLYLLNHDEKVLNESDENIYLTMLKELFDALRNWCNEETNYK